jgi:hypothetical protein
MHQIKTENDKCRNLCVRCHSAVTYAERTIGILQLKNKPHKREVSEYVKKRARYQVETLTKMLLETGGNEARRVQTLRTQTTMTDTGDC